MLSSSRRRGFSIVAAALAVGLCVHAFVHHRSLTDGLSWPAFDTQYREVAAAQTLLDEGLAIDSTYRDERPWYNPLASWVLAGLHRLGGWSLPELSPRLGAFINVLGPLAFFVMLARLINPWTALLALSAFIFVTPNAFDLGMGASYSPWFTPQNLAQPALYLGLTLAHVAYSRPFRVLSYAAVGMCLGVAFLSHTAAALVLGVAVLVLTAFKLRWGSERREALAGAGLILATAFAVALPFASSILFHYGLRVVNPWPALSPTSTLDLNEQPALLWKLLTRSPLAVAAVGAAAYFFRIERREWTKRVLLAWLVAVIVLFSMHEARLVLRRVSVSLPSIVPPHHFLFHLMALVSAGYGVALSWVCVRVAGVLDRGSAGRSTVARISVAAALLTVVIVWPWYVDRPEFTRTRQQAALVARAVPARAYEWIRANTRTSDVFLCTDDLSLFVVNPAGRKVVATNRYFSSPYLDWRSRDEDRETMFRALESWDMTRFARLATRYGVRYVMIANQPDREFLALGGVALHRVPRLRPADLADRLRRAAVFADERVSIFALER